MLWQQPISICVFYLRKSLVESLHNQKISDLFYCNQPWRMASNRLWSTSVRMVSKTTAFTLGGDRIVIVTIISFQEMIMSYKHWIMIWTISKANWKDYPCMTIICWHLQTNSIYSIWNWMWIKSKKTTLFECLKETQQHCNHFLLEIDGILLPIMSCLYDMALFNIYNHLYCLFDPSAHTTNLHNPI